jgi:hypothetical protein
MMKSIKRMVLTGAAVMVMMSFAAPAMAAPLSDYSKVSNPSSRYTDLLYSDVDVYKKPVEAFPPTKPGPDTTTPCYWNWSERSGQFYEIC